MVGTLPARLELRRVSAGLYEVPELDGVGVVQVSQKSWAVVRHGEAIPVRGVLEATTLTECWGRLADAVEGRRRG